MSKKSKEIKEFKHKQEEKFKPLYYQTLGDLELKTYDSKNIDSLFGTSEGFMERLQKEFKDEYENVAKHTQHHKVITLLYSLQPKCLMDIFWIGHFLGSKTMMDWTQGNLHFAPELYEEFKRDISDFDTKGFENYGRWDG